MRISDRLLKANGTNPDLWVDMFRKEHKSIEVDRDELLVWFSTMIFAGVNSDKNTALTAWQIMKDFVDSKIAEESSKVS
jgi:hypothetical protein